jgi:AcrR family transcriptional regulator
VDERQRHVLQVSLPLFMRFGFRRTSMADIAKAAGVSRPTLYGAFENKEALFAALIRVETERVVEDIDVRTQASRTLAESLRVALELVFLDFYRSPDQDGPSLGAEMLEVHSPTVLGALSASQASIERVLARAITRSGARFKGARLSAPKVARMLVASGRGVKAVATGPAEFEQMLDALVRVTVRAADP